MAILDQEVRRAHRQALDASHHGTHHPVSYIYTGNTGRPRAVIDRDWLAWAHQHRSTSAIARYLNLGRNRVREALIEYGLAERQEYPFEVHYTSSPLDNNPDDFHSNHHNDVQSLANEAENGEDAGMEPNNHADDEFGDEPPALEPIGPSRRAVYTQIRSYTNPVSQWTDEELDNAIARIRVHYHNAGLTLIRGSLLAMGQRVPRERIRQSLLRIDPVRRIFERRTIQRRTYSVPGPNSLWHHDGQHGKWLRISCQ